MIDFREEARKRGPGTHGFMDAASGEVGWFRVDTIGRVYAISSDLVQDHPFLPPGWHRPRHIRHPAYTLGYEMAVSYEYQVLMNDFFFMDGWDLDVLDMAADLVYPLMNVDAESYEGFVRYWQGVAAAVKRVRPTLLEALRPFTLRHGLDVLPWGEGWLLRNITSTARTRRPIPERETELAVEPVSKPLPPRRRFVEPRQSPAEDALLLYMRLAGVWADPEARGIVKPVLSFDDEGDNGTREDALYRRVMRVKDALGAHRTKGGRPPGQSRWNRDEVYYALGSFVGYMR